MEAEAIVFECMAVNPEYQWVCEHKILQSHIGVITNARLDHTDIMGPTLNSIASCLGNTIPRNGTLVTAETDLLPVLEERAALMNSKVCIARSSNVGDRELAGFAYESFAENIAIALEICSLLSIDREAAVAGMHAALPDPGTLSTSSVCLYGKDITFINALAANDVMSTRKIWDASVLRYPDVPRVLMYCSRSDRPGRSSEFAEAISDGWDADMYVIIGDGGRAFRRYLLARRIDASRVRLVGSGESAAVAEQVIRHLPQSAVLFAAGNFVGLGEEITNYFVNGWSNESVRFDPEYRSTRFAAPV